MKRFLAILVALWALTPVAVIAAQAVVPANDVVTYHDAQGHTQEAPLVVTARLAPNGTLIPEAASPAVTIAGFTPGNAYTTLAVTTSTGNVALPAGTVVVVYNTGASAAYIHLGTSGVTATTSQDAIQSGSWMSFTVGSNTFLAGITSSGSTSLTISGGAGIPTGSGGGGSGGGGGGASTIADGADVTQGANADAASAAGGTGTISAKLRRLSTQLPAAVGQTTMSASLPVAIASDQGTLPSNESLINGVAPQMGNGTTGTGTQRVTLSSDSTGQVAITGTVPLPSGAATAANQNVTAAGVSASNAQGVQGVTGGIPQSVTGTLTAVTAITNALPAGTNLIGKAGIDQTTPGTTNAVSATNFPSTVATGTGAQGATVPRITVATDTATVAGSATLPAGTNLIGKVGIDQTTPGTTNGVSQNAAVVVSATMQNAVAATGNGTVLAVSGESAAILTVNITNTATVIFEGTQDGTNYSAINAVQLGTTTIATSVSATGISLWETPVGGLTSVRARVSAFTSGTVTVTGQAVPVPYNTKVVNAQLYSAGSAVTYNGNGQAVMASSTPVTLASDQTIIGVAAGIQPGVATNASATGTTAATTATLAGVSSKTTYICGFSITADATAALAGNATVTGPIGGTMTFIENVGTATAASALTQNFNPCIPASATNTAIAVVSAAAGTGGNTAVNAWGFQK